MSSHSHITMQLQSDCVFCGHSFEFQGWCTAGSNDQAGLYAYCPTCEATGPPVRGNELGAVAAWNHNGCISDYFNSQGLRPCPFCGEDHNLCADGSYIVCMNCESTGPELPNDTTNIKELWNNRAAIHEPQKLIEPIPEELLEALRSYEEGYQ